ncbi:probable receptor-like protein kinase At1g11050 [Arachis stenosperma]|uniref:probable receptor-like protein kinase At1g11050 n=1 Tax=Arachis stenosperma TaxID=217475 RepID=UPI0025ABFDD8|nr:probable receptor-like protein kinase At1g11050 [Arachis stenosperma]
MKPVFVLLLIFLVAPTRPFSASSSSPTISHGSNNSVCPVGMDYVLTVPWNSSSCHNFQPFPSKNITRSSFCCTALLSLFGIALAQNLKENSLFQFPNLPTSKSCLHHFQSKLSALSLPNNLVSSCFDPLQFVISPNLCANIQSKQDWINNLGPTTRFNDACKPDLSVSANCDICVTEGLNVLQKMNAIDGNASHSQDCFYFSILYAAGIANELGPESRGAMSCIYELPLINDQGRGARRRSHNHALVFGLIGASIGILVVSSLIGLCLWYNRLGTRKAAENLYVCAEPTVQGSRTRVRPNTGSIWFKFEDLVKATNNFSTQNFIGRGGSGLVYKGILPDGTMVAVKRIEESDSQGDEEFYREVEIISNLKHRNLVLLRGCCVVDKEEEEDSGYRENQRYLVYDYMPNGSLEDHLFSSMDNRNMKKSLTWSQRKSIILDVANGLVYLHFGVKPAIYHRDIKTTNILLDAGMNARVADFGLAKQNIESRSLINTRVAGTHGYLAPEYALYGQLSEKSDVYSFGVVILEILCGRKALDLSSSGTSAFFISDWVWSLLKSGNLESALDASMLIDENLTSRKIIERFLMVGVLSSHVVADSRPTILDALKMLEGDIEIPPIPDRPMALAHHVFPIVI